MIELVLAVILGGEAGTTGAAAAPALVLRGVHVVDPAAGSVERDRSIVIAGDRILRIEAAAAPPPQGARVIECAGAFAVPGLIDCHVHLSFWGEPDAAGGAGPATVADPQCYPDALARFVGHGVTSVRDMGGDSAAIDDWRGRVARGEARGPRVFRAGPFLDGAKPNSKYRREILAAEDAAAAVREVRAAGADFLKVHSRLPRAAYFAVLEEAAGLGIAVTGHVPAGVTVLEAVAAGQHSLEHADVLIQDPLAGRNQDPAAWRAAFEVMRGPEGVALYAAMARRGTWLTPTLVSFERGLPGFGAPWDGFVSEFVGLVGRAHAAGVRVLAGTDQARKSHPVEPGAALVREIELLAEAGLTRAEALAAATTKAALALGRAGELGVLCEGALADVVLLRGDPLLDLGALREVTAVAAGGVLLDAAALDRLRAGEQP